MSSRLLFGTLLCVVAARGQVKTTHYMDPAGCVRTYHLAAGRVLTSRGLVEDSTVNAIMKSAVLAQMNGLRIFEVDKDAELEIRFMGGNSAGLQTNDLAAGDVAMWDIGGGPAVSGRTYKKSSLVIAAVDTKSNRTLWTARCTDKFGDPAHLEERIQKAVAKAFAKFPKKFACAETTPRS
jgi:hypothetical protein